MIRAKIARGRKDMEKIPHILIAPIKRSVTWHPHVRILKPGSIACACTNVYHSSGTAPKLHPSTSIPNLNQHTASPTTKSGQDGHVCGSLGCTMIEWSAMLAEVEG